MAAPRDQAARIVRPEAAGGRGRSRRATLRRFRRAVSRAAADDAVAAPPADVPGPTDDRRPAAAPARDSRRAEIRQAQVGADRASAPCWRSPLPAMACIIFWSAASCLAPTTPMCAPTTPCSARGSPATSRRSFPATTPWCAGRRDLPDRRRRLSHRGGCRAHQDRDPAGHHRPHRPPGHRAGKRGRAGQGAAGFGGSRA